MIIPRCRDLLGADRLVSKVEERDLLTPAWKMNCACMD
jgi:hypothetical protein